MSTRHITGLLVAAGLVGLLYFGWDAVQPLIRSALRGTPLRAVYAEFYLIIGAAFVVMVLTLAQWIWDRLPNPS